MKNIILIISVLQLLLLSCSNFEINHKEVPLAKVYDKYLYPSDIIDILPDKLSSKDSAAFIDSYINKWIISQLKLNKAEHNLSKEQKDVEKQLEEYKTSLLIYRYEQNFINQKLKNFISDEEIEVYYNSFSGEYKLDKDIIKVFYVTIPKNASNIYIARKLYKSDKEEDLKKLKNYCLKNACKLNVDNNWLDFNMFFDDFPQVKINNSEQFLRNNKFIETQDSLNYFFIKINDYKFKNDTSPLIFVKDDISNIIINKRKYQLIKEMENKLYEDNKKNFEIYINKK